MKLKSNFIIVIKTFSSYEIGLLHNVEYNDLYERQYIINYI
jgi:hypothetical protein